ncbi:MAG: adenosine deaminase family protein [Christensenellales bacterium]|jgi:adenosine deaminase
MEPYLYSLIKAMPKAELHLHLDGSLLIDTAVDLLAVGGESVSWQDAYKQMVVEGRLESQRELLKYFDLPISLMQSQRSLRRAAYELILLKAADNVKYIEIRFAPELHTKCGLSAPDVVNAVFEGAKRASELTGTAFSIIAVFMRGTCAKENTALLKAIWKSGASITAVDIAGDESASPDVMEQYAVFETARDMGLGVTMHWGEAQADDQRLLSAIEAIRPDRLAHGAPVSESRALIDAVIKKDIMLDLCPTSNIQAGLYPSYRHFPLKELIRAGVSVSVSTDDTVLSDISLSKEYRNAVEGCGISIGQMCDINMAAARRSFAPEHIRDRLLESFDKWGRRIDELR